jgi:tripartite-type tricarboxylate transporter receptor subunit TctC
MDFPDTRLLSHDRKLALSSYRCIDYFPFDAHVRFSERTRTPMGPFSRRRFLSLAAAASALPAFARVAWAQDYPRRPVRIVVGVAAGSPTDVLSRLVGQWLSERLGQQFVIDNRPGAGTNLATEAVVRAPADGYTLLAVAPSSAINAALYEKLKFNFMRDIAPVASIVRQPSVVVVHPSVPAKTIPDFIAYAKAKPGKVSMASPGTGTGPHLAGELFKMMAGVEMVHVPYRGAGPATTDLIAGQVQFMVLAPVVALPLIRERKLRALAVTTLMRSGVLPDMPTVGEFLPGYDYSFWFGVGAPKAIPSEIVDKLNNEINAGLADPKMRARLDDLGGGAFASSPTDFGRLIADETERWSKVVKFAGLKAR